MKIWPRNELNTFSSMIQYTQSNGTMFDFQKSMIITAEDAISSYYRRSHQVALQYEAQFRHDSRKKFQ